MKLIIAAFPLATVTVAQSLGAAVPTVPVCIITGISAFACAYIVLRFLYSIFFPNQ